mmetsp:Transcript_130654/g.377955  ORF Transcript_130654/g.377955 Transcript_130654/m.377955 type:complete len:153 (+) Transcript_130654:1922-2380(+)
MARGTGVAVVDGSMPVMGSLRGFEDPLALGRLPEGRALGAVLVLARRLLLLWRLIWRRRRGAPRPRPPRGAATVFALSPFVVQPRPAAELAASVACVGGTSSVLAFGVGDPAEGRRSCVVGVRRVSRAAKSAHKPRGTCTVPAPALLPALGG